MDIALPPKIISDSEMKNDAPEESVVASLMHTMSNKDKIRQDVDGPAFMKSVNESGKDEKENEIERDTRREEREESIRRSSEDTASNLFSHLKNVSERIEKEDDREREDRERRERDRRHRVPRDRGVRGREARAARAPPRLGRRGRARAPRPRVVRVGARGRGRGRGALDVLWRRARYAGAFRDARAAALSLSFLADGVVCVR